MRSIWRALLAFWLAAVFFVFTGDVVDAQRPPYEGPLFWMSAPGAHPGSNWIEPPLRSWMEAPGEEWHQATSFPTERIWESAINGAPPNDPCFRDVAMAVTDPDTGPYGLQTSQFFAEWWDGNVYFGHPSPPPAWNYFEYGGFRFRYRPPQNGVYREPYDSGTGAPQLIVGTSPGACVGGRLALQRGSQDGGVWMPYQLGGNPCYSTAHFYRLRLNTELRCEPHLGDQTDPYTELFWEFYDLRVPTVPVFYDGTTTGAIRFPSTYTSDPYPFFRRIDVGFSKLVNDLDAFPPDDSLGPQAVAASTFFDLPGGGTTAPSARPEYFTTSTAAWMTGLTADIRASRRNSLVVRDDTGEIRDSFIEIYDGYRDEMDCLFFTAVTHDGNQMESPAHCGDDVAKSRMTSVTTVESGGRPDDIGPIQVDAIDKPGPEVWRAHARAQPFAVGGGEWLDFTPRNLLCTESTVLVDAEYVFFAEAAIEQHLRFAQIYWELYLGVSDIDYPDLDDYNRVREYYRQLSLGNFMDWQGWLAVYDYRALVLSLLEAAVAASSPPIALVHHRFVAPVLDGEPYPASCEAFSMTLQPERTYVNDNAQPAWDGLPPPALLPAGTAGTRDLMTPINLFEPQFGVDGLLGAQGLGVQEKEHYWSGNIGSFRGGVSIESADLVGGPDMFPVGPTHGAESGDLDVYDSPSFFISYTCGSPETDVFAREVTHITPNYQTDADPDNPGSGLNPGDLIYTPRGEFEYQGPAVPDAPFEPDALGGRCDRPDGTSCYSAQAVAELAARYPGTRAAAAYAAAAAAPGVVDGRVRQPGRVYDSSNPIRLPNIVEEVGSSLHGRPSLAGRHAGSFVREWSGDLLVDSSGNATQQLLESAPSGGAFSGLGNNYSRPTAYAVQPLRFLYRLGAAVDLRLGLPDLDHRHGGFSYGPGGIEVRTRYFGSSPGTHLASLHFADVEQMALYGPVRYNGAMEAAKGGTLGSCTVCSEKGCDAATVEDFPGERFTSKVSTTGRMVCLIETNQAPPDDCPGP